ncbi:hypothetical protein OE88DRAFT_1657337 [Heliocybe sulcata]|uniref:Uncharacterized protein n=1 Tax=Heliocybe sulcata TaxID=5364 RepID=A0A5C3N4Z2_9AGAM|nr:hypothetical protein OE88DRAFT_1657337 [Heliocybe sulcata]
MPSYAYLFIPDLNLIRGVCGYSGARSRSFRQRRETTGITLVCCVVALYCTNSSVSMVKYSSKYERPHSLARHSDYGRLRRQSLDGIARTKEAL